MTDPNLTLFHWINLGLQPHTLLLWLARISSTVLPSAALVGWSRVALGLHFPLYVLAGAGVGCLCSGLACQLMALRGGDWVLLDRSVQR